MDQTPIAPSSSNRSSLYRKKFFRFFALDLAWSDANHLGTKPRLQVHSPLQSYNMLLPPPVLVYMISLDWHKTPLAHNIACKHPCSDFQENWVRSCDGLRQLVEQVVEEPIFFCLRSSVWSIKPEFTLWQKTQKEYSFKQDQNLCSPHFNSTWQVINRVNKLLPSYRLIQASQLLPSTSIKNWIPFNLLLI